MHLHVFLPVVLVAAWALGEIAQRLKAPRLIGEIAAGIALGPAVLRFIAGPSTDPSYELISEVGHLGLCVLLFQIGLHTRFVDLRAVWKPSAVVGLAGLALPFLLGWGLASLWQWPPPAALFAGAAFTVTSLSVTAATLTELRMEASSEGRIILGAALLGDVLGLLLLSLLGAWISAQASVARQVMWAVGQAAAFVLAGFLLGPLVVQGIVRVADWTRNRWTLLVLAFSFLLLVSHAAQAAGFEKIIGAYAAGLAFARHGERERLAQQLEPLTALLTPLFFVLVGASITFANINLPVVVALIAAALLGKLLAPCVLWRTGLNRWVIGSALTPRGGIGFAFAQTALAAGALNAKQFSSVALAILGTTVIGPILLRLSAPSREGISGGERSTEWRDK